jgi:hypothetical protein
MMYKKTVRGELEIVLERRWEPYWIGHVTDWRSSAKMSGFRTSVDRREPVAGQKYGSERYGRWKWIGGTYCRITTILSMLKSPKLITYYSTLGAATYITPDIK